MKDQNADSPELKINWFIMKIKGTKKLSNDGLLKMQLLGTWPSYRVIINEYYGNSTPNF